MVRAHPDFQAAISRYEGLTRVELKAIADDCCDLLRIHQDYWPKVVLKRVGMEGDMGEVQYDAHDGQPTVYVYNTYLRNNNISQVSVLLHECAHIAIKYAMSLDMEDREEEAIVCLLEKLLYMLYIKGAF